MTKSTNTALIGAFVLGGLTLLAAALIAVGGGFFKSDMIRYVAYFDGSLTGLQVGAAVRFRGAPVGSVTGVRLELLEPSGQILLPVTFDLNQNSIYVDGVSRSEEAEDAHELIRTLIRRGLRASLALESIVTGQLYIELDFVPDTPIRTHDARSEYPEFPTARSPLQKFSETLKRLPVDDLAASMRNSLEGLSTFFNSPDLRDAIKTADDLMHKAVDTLHKVDQHLLPLARDVNRTAEESQRTLEAARLTIQSLQRIIAEGSPVRYKLLNSLDEISAAARALRSFADYMERHPEALFYGKEREKRR